jgi:hypothetical protein
MRLHRLIVLSVSVPVLVLAAACGGSPETPPATPATPAAPVDTSAAPAASAAPASSAAPADTAAPAATPAPAAANVPAPAKPWDAMNHKERLEVMKTAVLPNMKTAFQNFDSKTYADFSCKTCHGVRLKQGNFDMPNPDLPKLDFKNQLKADIDKHPATVKFMHEVVSAQMATMLGVAPFDMKTMKGFGCGSCHTGK